MENKVEFTLQHVSDLIYAFDRMTSVFTNDEAIDRCKAVSEALDNFWAWYIRHGAKMESKFTITDTYIELS